MIGLEAQTLLERFHQLTEHRQSHSMRVIGVMEELADRHGLDPELARWAGFGHDLAREFSRP
ncbi:MAG: HD domain-containing protein, partial [Firmicutes bacterium]|nr:HD domain-containing protein [Bacillota bacterium]